MAELYRQVEARHLATAKIAEMHATRMERWLDGAEGEALRPVFMAAVAATLGVPSAAATLRGQRHAAVMVAASDATARGAYELESVMAEGPATEAATEGMSITAAGGALLDRWPRYGPVVAELGVRAVIAAPLGLPDSCLGALCVYDRKPAIAENLVTTATSIADVLTHMMLHAGPIPASDESNSALPLFDEADYQAVVHQAAGMVSVQCDCGVDDAEDLLAARAFASGTPVEEIAMHVVCGETFFG